MAAGLEHARELAHGLLRILDMLQPFETRYVVKRAIAERQFRIEIATMNIHAIEPENLRIEITTANIEAGIDQTSGQRAFAGRNIQDRAARKWFENTKCSVMNRLMGERHRLTPSISGVPNHCG